MSLFTERILALELRAIIDEAHEYALQTEEFLGLTRCLDDRATARVIVDIETAQGIHWGEPLTQPLTVDRVRAAFAAIERGENPDD